VIVLYLTGNITGVAAIILGILRVTECHRRLIAEYLVEKKRAEVEHIE